MPFKFGGAPQCPRCHKSVYMAEQAIGPGGAWHSQCLKCKECNKPLDSSLTERGGEVYCRGCYTRKWGPKGYGFAGGAAFLSTDSLPSEVHSTRRSSSPSIPATTAGLPSVAPVLPARPQVPPKRGVTEQEQEQEPEFNITETEEQEQPPPSLKIQPPPPIPPRLQETQLPSVYYSVPTTSSHQPRTSYVPRKLGFNVQVDTCTKCKKAVYAAELALGAGNKYHKLCLKCCDCGKLLNSTNMVDRDFDLYCRVCYSKSYGPKGFRFGNLLPPEGSSP
ncbi:hypothetical protein BDF14DRAFT_721340 [Spinellus fusiger]|nr:hypothetical protein BDF14DRAFT_721340 [Spinellus fusiger]